MRYETVQTLSDEAFKRATGVRRTTFNKMLEVLEEGAGGKGRPPKLSRPDQLLMTLMYWREYRTEFHIGLTYGISESAVCRTIQKVENQLLRSKQFHLPGKKALQASDDIFEIVLVDATEQPIERPQKDNVAISAERRGAIRKRLRGWRT